jgi:hypothetical protein
MGEGKREGNHLTAHVEHEKMWYSQKREGPVLAAPRVRGLYPDQQNNVTADPDKYHENMPHGLAPFPSGFDFGTLARAESQKP